MKSIIMILGMLTIIIKPNYCKQQEINVSENNYSLLCYNRYFQPIYFAVNEKECVFNKGIGDLLNDKKKDDIEKIKQLLKKYLEIDQCDMNEHNYCFSCCKPDPQTGKNHCAAKAECDDKWFNVSNNAWVFMAILLGFKLIVLFIMTCVLFSAIRNREKILDLNEEIVRRSERLESPPHSSYFEEDEEKNREKSLTGIEIEDKDEQDEFEDEEEFEFYEETHAPLGLLTK